MNTAVRQPYQNVGRSQALVTGAYGTVGRYVARVLAEGGYAVTGLGRGAWGETSGREWGLRAWHSAAVTLESLESLDCRPDVIIHCAGSGAVGASFQAPHVDFQRNVETTAAVLEFMRRHCPDAALVYPSSAAVYGVADALPIAVGSPLRPVSPYGLHKKLAEEMVIHYAATFGLRVAVVRLFSIYGEGLRKQLLWDACRRIKTGETGFFGTGEETRDWLHVTDAAALLALAAGRADTTCPVVNGGSGIRVTVREVLAELFALMERSDGPRFCGTVRPGDPQHYQADMAEVLGWGWQPQVPWQIGLRRYVDWFRQDCP